MSGIIKKPIITETPKIEIKVPVKTSGETPTEEKEHGIGLTDGSNLPEQVNGEEIFNELDELMNLGNFNPEDMDISDIIGKTGASDDIKKLEGLKTKIENGNITSLDDEFSQALDEIENGNIPGADKVNAKIGEYQAKIGEFEKIAEDIKSGKIPDPQGKLGEIESKIEEFKQIVEDIKNGNIPNLPGKLGELEAKIGDFEKITESIKKGDISALADTFGGKHAENIKTGIGIAKKIEDEDYKGAAGDILTQTGVKPEGTLGSVIDIVTSDDPQKALEEKGTEVLKKEGAKVVAKTGIFSSGTTGQVVDILTTEDKGERNEKIVKTVVEEGVKKAGTEVLGKTVPLAGAVIEAFSGGEKSDRVKELKASINTKNAEIKKLDKEIKAQKPNKKDAKFKDAKGKLDTAKYNAAIEEWKKNTAELQKQLDELKQARDEEHKEYRKLNPSFLTKAGKGVAATVATAIGGPILGAAAKTALDNA